MYKCSTLAGTLRIVKLKSLNFCFFIFNVNFPDGISLVLTTPDGDFADADKVFTDGMNHIW